MRETAARNAFNASVALRSVVGRPTEPYIRRAHRGIVANASAATGGCVTFTGLGAGRRAVMRLTVPVIASSVSRRRGRIAVK